MTASVRATAAARATSATRVRDSGAGRSERRGLTPPRGRTFNGRVGRGTTSPPHRTGGADFPHPAHRHASRAKLSQELTAAASQIAKPIALQSRIQTLALSKRTTAPLAPMPEKASESHLQVVVQRTECGTRIPVAEIRRPPAQQRVHRPDGLDEGAIRPPARQVAQLVPHPCQRSLRGDNVEVPSLPSESIAIVTKGEAEKVQARLRAVQSHHLRFGSVHRQPEVLFERPFKPRHDPWPHPPRQHHESSSGGELHPSAPTEPDVKLSPHPAPTLQRRVSRRVATGRRDSGPVARCTPASASTHALDVETVCTSVAPMPRGPR